MNNIMIKYISIFVIFLHIFTYFHLLNTIRIQPFLRMSFTFLLLGIINTPRKVLKHYLLLIVIFVLLDSKFILVIEVVL